MDLAAKSFVLDGQVIGTPGTSFLYLPWRDRCILALK
jgi:hypothetical protein